MNGFRPGKKLTNFQLRMILEKQKIKDLLYDNDNEYMNKDRVDNVISGGYYLNKNISHNLKFIPYMSYLRNLPEEIKGKVSHYIKNNPIKESGCWFNATKLHFKYPEINVEHGYYTNKETKNYLSQDARQLLDLIIKNKLGVLDENNMLEVTKKNPYHKTLGYYINAYSSSSERHENQPFYFWYDKTNKKWENFGRHTWNSYKGIHFDITGTFLKKGWEKCGKGKVWLIYQHSLTTNPTSSYKDTEPEFYNELVRQNENYLEISTKRDMNHIYKLHQERKNY